MGSLMPSQHLSNVRSLQHLHTPCKHINAPGGQADQALPVWEDTESTARHLPVCAATGSPGLQYVLPAPRLHEQATPPASCQQAGMLPVRLQPPCVRSRRPHRTCYGSQLAPAYPLKVATGMCCCKPPQRARGVTLALRSLFAGDTSHLVHIRRLEHELRRHGPPRVQQTTAG